VHERQKYRCKDCCGKSICDGIQRNKCKPCGGSSIYTHDRQRARCPECNGRPTRSVCKAHTRCGHRGNPTYDKYCTHCFSNLFKDDPRVQDIHKKSKETKWANAILTEIPLDGWMWDKSLYVDFYGGCSIVNAELTCKFRSSIHYNISFNECQCPIRRGIAGSIISKSEF
jgi:hypothetical protein